MNKTNLYDLPKDMLIKIIMTIDEENRIRLKEKEENRIGQEELCNIYKDIIESCGRMSLHKKKCDYPGCKAIYFDADYANSYFHNCEDMFECFECYDVFFCNQHNKLIKNKNGDYCCDKCLNIYEK